MGVTYTDIELRKALESDPQHGAMWTLVLGEFVKHGFTFAVQDLGVLSSWKVTAWGVYVSTRASDISIALSWARNGMREWAWQGIQSPNTYFAEIARAWALS